MFQLTDDSNAGLINTTAVVLPSQTGDSMVQTQPDPVQRFWKLIDEIRAIDARKKALEDELFQLQLQLPEDFDPDDDEVTGRGKSAEE